MRGFAQHLYTLINFSDLRELVNFHVLPLVDLCTKISEVDLSEFIYSLFHEHLSIIVGTNTVLYCIWSDS